MKRIIYILIFGFILSSCDDFLTEEPVHKQTLENAVVDYDGAQNIINGMYASLTLGSGTSGSDFFGGSLACAYLLRQEYLVREEQHSIRCHILPPPVELLLIGNNGMPA